MAAGNARGIYGVRAPRLGERGMGGSQRGGGQRGAERRQAMSHSSGGVISFVKVTHAVIRPRRRTQGQYQVVGHVARVGNLKNLHVYRFMTQGNFSSVFESYLEF